MSKPSAVLLGLLAPGLFLAAAHAGEKSPDRPAVAVGRYIYEHMFKKSPPPGRRDGAGARRAAEIVGIYLTSWGRSETKKTLSHDPNAERP